MILNDGSPRSSIRLQPERIKEAREARGFTLESFAVELSVSKQAVFQYETGQSAPSAQVMSAIVRATAQPLAFFVSTPDRQGEPSAPFWRSLKRMELHHRRRIARRLQWASDVVHYVDQFIELPRVNIVPFEFDPDGDEDSQIEHAAESLRDLWSLGRGPIRDLAGTLEENGIILVREPVACKDMDGVSCWVRGRPYILLSGEVESGPRDLFNLAHELAHLVLHAGIEVCSDILNKIERQANRFASAFLLPQETFGREVFGTSVHHFQLLKERWGVAISAMAYRCKDLGLMSADQYSYLLRQMAVQKIRQVEPLDYSFDVSRPRLLRESLEMLIEHGVQSRAQIEAALCLSVRDVESLCGLPPGYLESRIVKFQLRERYAEDA